MFHPLHDAATMSGVTKFQRLTKLNFTSFSTHYVGIKPDNCICIVYGNYCIFGTEDLGQYILKALSDKQGGGKGLTLGICVAFIGLIFDNLIRTWVDQKKHLGILMQKFIVSIDQGTTSSRAILFDLKGKPNMYLNGIYSILSQRWMG